MDHCEVQRLENGNFRRIYSGDVNQTAEGLDCLNWREVNASQIWNETEWLIGDHNYCRNPGFDESTEFCYVNESQRALCAVKTCGKYQFSLQNIIILTRSDFDKDFNKAINR